MIIEFPKKGFFNRVVWPFAQTINKNKLIVFLIMYAFWLIDIGSTAIALLFFNDKFYEVNKIAALFFTYGIFGWIGWMIVCGFLILGLIYLPNVFLKIDIWLFNKTITQKKIKNLNNFYILLRVLNIFIFIILELIVIINNIKLLIEVI